MQPISGGPRSLLAEGVVLGIIQGPTLRIMEYGLEEVDVNGDVINDHTNRLVSGEINRDCYAKIHGGCNLTLREGIAFEKARVRPSITLKGEPQWEEVTKTIDAGPAPYDTGLLAVSSQKVPEVYCRLGEVPRDYKAVTLGLDPVGYWRLGETSGTTAVDSSGNGNDGTYVGTVQFGEPSALAHPGGDTSVITDSSNACITLNTNLTSDSALTLLAWHKHDPSRTSWRTVFAHSSDNLHHLVFQNNQDIGIWDGGFRDSGVNKPTDSAWHFYGMIVRSDGTATLWLDGVEQSTFAHSLDPAVTGVGSIGGWPNSNYPIGPVDEPAIFDRELTAAEITALYEEAQPVTPSPTATDQSGNNRDGTYLGNLQFGEPGAIHDQDTCIQWNQGDTTFPRIRWANPTWLPKNAAYTLECWIATTTTTPKALFSYGAANELLVFVEDTQTTLYSGASTLVITHNSVADGYWHHFVVVHFGVNATIWVDGVQGSINSVPTIPDAGASAYFVVGQEQDLHDGGYDTAQAWVGLIDEVAIYDYGFSSAEVEDHYHLGRGYTRLSTTYTTLVDTSPEAKFYLGVYVLDVPEEDIGAVPSTFNVTGYDLLAVVNDLVGSSYRVATGTNVVDAVKTILNDLGEINHLIEPTTETLPNDRIWPLDATTSWLDIINDLFDSIGYRDLWVDWVGRYRSSPFVEPTDRGSEFTYTDDPSTTIIAQDRSLTPDYFKAPNRWVFIRDDVRSGRFTLGNSGVYEEENIGDGLTSQSSRGRTITKVEYIEAVSASALARSGKKVIEKDKHIGITIDADVRLNPLHWHFDVVTWSDAALGTDYKALVHEWTFPIMEGGQANMSLMLRKV